MLYALGIDTQADALQGCVPAFGAEVATHVPGHGTAGVAAQYPALEARDAQSVWSNNAEAHLKSHILSIAGCSQSVSQSNTLSSLTGATRTCIAKSAVTKQTVDSNLGVESSVSSSPDSSSDPPSSSSSSSSASASAASASA